MNDNNQLPEPQNQADLNGVPEVSGSDGGASSTVTVSNVSGSTQTSAAGQGQVSATPSTAQSTQPADNTQAPDDSQQASVIADTPAIADDVDLIEKVWVEKAKEIVDKTRDNPYLQNKALGQYKAGYIKKRYNKDIPAGE